MAMSLLSIGTKCSSCPLVDFLPFTCPHCKLAFCSNHINQHTCSSTDDSSEAGPSAIYKRGRKECEYTGCERESIQSIGGLIDGQERGEGIAREVRCEYCQGSFCAIHRAQTSHSCSAPLTHEKEYSAFLQRREKGKQVIAQHFPEFAGKVIPKPPPAKDVLRKKPASPERLPPSLLASTSISQLEGDSNVKAKADESEKKIKSKAFKIHELNLRKLRMGAKPLDSKSTTTSSAAKRRFFEYAVAADGDGDNARRKCEAWKDGKGSWDGKTERVWVNSDMPIGKVLDLIIAQAKVSRPKTADPNDSLGLLNLSAEPDTPRKMKRLDLSKTSGSEEGIIEGSIILLIRGN